MSKVNPNILTVANTTALEALGRPDALQVAVTGVGLFNFASSGTADGVTIFDANLGGVWVQQIKDGANTPWFTITDATTLSVDMKNGVFQKVEISATRDISFTNLHPTKASAIIIRVKHIAGGTKINIPGFSEFDDFFATGVDQYTVLTGVYDPEDDFWIWDSIVLADPADLPDTDAPLITSIEAIDTGHIRVTFNEISNGTMAGWSFDNGATVMPSSVAGTGTNTWTFAMSGLAAGQTITANYDPSTGDTMDAAGNELATQTGIAVTNSIAGYQAESIAYFAANTGLTTGQQDRLDALIVAFKGVGWSKFDALYPFLGSSAAANKWNAVNPLDTDGAFRLSFNGSFTHNGNGITGGGTTSDYASTHYNPSAHMSSNNGCIGAYVKSGWSDGQTIVGAFDSGSGLAAQMPQAGGGHAYWQMGENAAGAMNADPSAYSKFVAVSRTGSLSTDCKGYRDGTNFGNQLSAFSGHVNLDLYIGARNAGSGTRDTPSTAVIGLVFIANVGLTSGELTTLKTAIDTWVAGEGRA